MNLKKFVVLAAVCVSAITLVNTEAADFETENLYSRSERDAYYEQRRRDRDAYYEQRRRNRY